MSRPSAYLVQHFLELSAARRADAPFLTLLDKTSTYGDVEQSANRLAHALGAVGVRPGDRVAMLVGNSPFYATAYYGILKAGGVVVSLNTATTADTLAHYLRDSGAQVLIVGARLERHVAAALGHAVGVRAVFAEQTARIGDIAREPAATSHVEIIDVAAAMAAQSTDAPLATRISLDLAAIVYTSGSTGLPRGAMLSHQNLVTNTQSIVQYLRLTERDRVLAVLPFYYVYGKTLLNTHAAVGGSVVIENRSMFPNVVLDSLEQQACTGFAGVPSTYAIFVNRSNLAERALPQLRYLTQAGAAMAPELTRRLRAAVPGKELFVMYGATEASARLTYLDPAQLDHKVGSIGKAIPNVEMTVLRDDGSEADDDETGELVARGANIMQGYWNDPEGTSEALDARGYYHTGDLGRRDAEGFFFVVGRKKDMIKAGGHRIAAKTIEEAVAEHTAIHENAAIGIPDEILGEAVCIVAVLREGQSLSASELEKFLRDRLPAHAMPKLVIFRDSLPKNESGKIMKQPLRDEMA